MAMTTTSASSAKWYKRSGLFPRAYQLGEPIVSNDEKYVSFAFRSTNLKEVIESFADSGGAMKSKGINVNKNKGDETKLERGLRKLGKPPKGLFAESEDRHGNASVIPSALSYAQYKCYSFDFHTRHEPGRETYIEKLNPSQGCTFSFTIRNFADEIALLTYEVDSYVHTCQGKNFHLLPLSGKQKMFFLKGVMAYGSVQTFHDEVLVPMSLQAANENRPLNRMEILDMPAAERLARELGIDLTVKSGVRDFECVLERVLNLRAKGATVAFKLSGWSCDHPKAIVHPLAKQFLQKDDFFILVSTAKQISLLATLGKMVSTDGTHSVFQYNNIKVIVVLVSSFSLDKDMKERGFPVCAVLTTSEREDIHKAIVTHLSGAAPTWKPELLMTDMAFSAFNAWVTFFPGLLWLWCVFHVWQAWIKRLRQASRPDWITKDEWSVLKGHLIREIKELISPKKNPEIDLDEFFRRCGLVSNVLWIADLSDMALAWDSYVKNAMRWAPPARRQAVETIFGSSKQMPMLAKSNNCLEAFFGVLKYTILDGRSLRTVNEFFNLWELYQARLVRNMVLCRVLHHLVDVSMHVPQESDPFEVEDDVDPGIRIAAEESDDEIDNIEDGGGADGDEQDLAEQPFETVRAALDQRIMEEEWESLSSIIVETLDAIVRTKETVQNVRQLRVLRRTMENARNAAIAINTSDVFDGSKLGIKRASLEFIRQRQNFAPNASFVSAPATSASVIATATSAPLSEEVSVLVAAALPRANVVQPPQAISQEEATTIPSSWPSTLTAPAADCSHNALAIGPMEHGDFYTSTSSAASVTCAAPAQPTSARLADPGLKRPGADNEADFDALYKRKKKKATRATSRLTLAELSFVDYSQKWLADPDVPAKIEAIKKKATELSLPLLQAALKWNTMNRIRAVALDIYNAGFPTSINKADLISRFVSHIQSCAPQMPLEISVNIADIGIVHRCDDYLIENEIVFLEKNAMSNFGEACVAAQELLSGWVVRNAAFVKVDIVNMSNVHWGKLVEKQKEPSIIYVTLKTKRE
jgi:hypothetical protein